MRKLTVLLVLLLFAGLQVAFAQRTITGKVTAENETPLPGVTVVIKGTTNGVSTGPDGNYSISVPNNQTVLQFSFIGFLQEEVTVGSQSVINVTLEESTEELEEIVVTALGIKRESKRLGYSATSVDTEELSKDRTTNMMESLEGKVSGLNITPPAAGAGASTQIRLRGQVAFAGANNAPLIVINGLPIDQGAQGASGRGNQRDLGDNLNNINPDDIESMTVLKGATAAAIYGSRAANGAIIITTKSGQLSQGIGVEVTSSYTAQEVLSFFEFQDQYGLGTFGAKPTSAANASSNGQMGWGAAYDGELVPAANGDMIPYEFHPNRITDYFNTGQNFTNTVAFSGGNEKGSFRASISNTDSKGIEPTNEYKRNIANLGVNYNIAENLNFTMNVNYTNEEYINPPQIGTQGPGSMNFLTRTSQSIPLELMKESAVDPNTGTELFWAGWNTINNPYYAQQAGQLYNRVRDRFLGSATLRWDITDYLFMQGSYNYDYAISFTENKTPGGIATNQPQNSDGTYKGSYSVGQGWGTDVNADFLIGFSEDFDKFSVEANFGGNTFRVRNRNFNQNVSNFVVRDFFSISNGVDQNLGYGFNQSRVNSLYGIAEFGYNDMIYLNFTGRNDWFSVLNPDSNSDFYPSVSGSFIFSELLDDLTWLDYAKVRGSWAQVGSANGVGTYEGNLTYNINSNQFNGQTLAGISGNSAPNPNLQPFTVEEKEIGLEGRLFNSRLSFDIAVFDKVTTDQILNVQLSNTSGYGSSKKNLGSLQNQGIELMFEYSPIQTNDFSWTSSWNHTILRTEVLSVGENPDGTPIEDLLLIYFNGTGNEFLGELHYTVGMSMNQLYTRKIKRNEAGQQLVRDNGFMLATDDFEPVGTSIPKNTGGWTNTFRYKNLSLGVFIDYKLGGTVLSSTLLNMTRQGHSMLSLEGRRIFDDGTVEEGLLVDGVYESTGEPNTSVVDPRFLQFFTADYRNLQIGDPFTFKSDYVKLRNISLTYDLSDVLRKVDALGFVKGLTFTASCRNVAILYKDIPNVDPEAIQSSGDTRSGYENSSLPTTRNYMFSVNAKF